MRIPTPTSTLTPHSIEGADAMGRVMQHGARVTLGTVTCRERIHWGQRVTGVRGRRQPRCG